MKNILTKLNKIQTTLKAPKGQMNKFGGYKYRSCEDIMEAVKPLLAEHGCVLTVTDEIIEVAGRVYVRATATIADSESGETHFTQALAREAEVKKGMDESQITGAASSYARKYALNGLFAIDDTKDADTQDNTKQSALTDSLKKKIDSITDRDDLVKLYEKSTDKQVRDYITKRGEAINAG